jgi:hypothetical protein
VLGQSPPGYTPFSVNRQATQLLVSPGVQGTSVRNAGTAPSLNPGSSSYLTPSSVASLKSPLAAGNSQNVAQYLMGGRSTL